MVHTRRLLWFLLIAAHIIESRNIQLTSTQGEHLNTTYQYRSDNYVNFDIFLMSCGDNLNLGALLRHMGMS